jgi:hypothetical protein
MLTNTEVFLNSVSGNTLVSVEMLKEDAEFVATARKYVVEGTTVEQLVDNMTTWVNENY